MSLNCRGLFADFDGVMHPSPSIVGMKSSSSLLVEREKRNLFRWNQSLATSLEDHPDVALFVHSNWRLVYPESQIREMLGPLLPWYAGVTPPDIQNRLNSIKATIERFGITHHIILDDAYKEFPKEHPSLVVCHPLFGLSDDRATNALNDWLERTSPMQHARQAHA